MRVRKVRVRRETMSNCFLGGGEVSWVGINGV